MPQWHGGLGKRKRTGGKTKAHRSKRKFESGSPPSETLLGPYKIKKLRTRGGNVKLFLLKVERANVTDPASKKTKRVEILRVVKNPTNVDYDRRGVLTKGAVIETSLGRAKVTARPGQDGVVNAVLIEETSP